MKIIYMGGGEFGCDTLRWLHSSHHELLQAYTQPARPAGRGREPRLTPVAQVCKTLGVECIEAEQINSDEMIEKVRAQNPDVIVVIAFGQWLGKKFLELPCRIINLHSSLLPKYRGAAPINWAIIQGEKESGVTVIELNEVWDGGAVIAQERTEIGKTETAGELHDRLAAMGPALIAEVLGEFEAGIYSPVPQDETVSCKAPKLKKSDGEIDWNRTAKEINGQILGMWPWPGAYFHALLENNSKLRVSVCRCELLDEPAETKLQPGQLDSKFNIACGDGKLLKLIQVKPDNGKVMDFKSFANGRRIKPGHIFV